MNVLLSIVALAILLWPSSTLAQATHSSSAILEFQATDNTITGSPTLASVSDGYLLVCAYARNAQTVTGVTALKGSMATAMTKLVEKTDTTFGALYLSLWGLTAPDSGANTITATLSGTPSVQSGGSYAFYSGADQTTPASNATSAEGNDTTPSVTVTSASGKLVVDCVYAGGLAGSLTVDGSQTQRVNQTDGSFGDYFGISEEAGAASISMDWTTGNSTVNVSLGVSLNEAAGGATRQPCCLLGVF